MSHAIAQVPDIAPLKANEDVYEPSDDTFLFLDALKKDMPHILQSRSIICAEIGCGSGVIITYLATCFKAAKHEAMYFATDINISAAKLTDRTMKLHAIPVCDVIRTDLLSGIRCKIHVLLFNPPYVPTPSDEIGSLGIEAAWAGGMYGREVMDRVLGGLESILEKDGMLYMVAVAENKPQEIAEKVAQQGFQTEVILTRTARNEKLFILRIQRSKEIHKDIPSHR